MLGLAEKNILNYDFDPVASDPSDANTNSTTLFSDDTDDLSRRSTNPEMGMSTHQEDESAAASASAAAAAAAEPSPGDPQKYRPDVPGISDRRTGHLSSGPKKSELKIGESSAFFTYVKPSTVKKNSQGVALIEDNTNQNLRMEEKLQVCGEQMLNDAHLQENGEALEIHSQVDDFRSSSSIPDSLSLERSCTPPMSREFPQRNFKDDRVLMHQTNEPQLDASSLSTQSVYPYFMSGVVNQVMMSSSAQLYQKNLHELQSHGTSAMLPGYNHLPQCPPHMSGMASFPYYPVSICLQPGQMPTTPSWPSFGSSTSSDVKLNKVDRREAALNKFRQKRKERCFDKKIRYVNRKKLAERRPRVRGQFVRKVNGVNVDLNGQPASTDYDEDEEEDGDEQASRDSSPEDDASGS